MLGYCHEQGTSQLKRNATLANAATFVWVQDANKQTGEILPTMRDSNATHFFFASSVTISGGGILPSIGCGQ